MLCCLTYAEQLKCYNVVWACDLPASLRTAIDRNMRNILRSEFCRCKSLGIQVSRTPVTQFLEGNGTFIIHCILILCFDELIGAMLRCVSWMST